MDILVFFNVCPVEEKYATVKKLLLKKLLLFLFASSNKNLYTLTSSSFKSINYAQTCKIL